MDFQWRCKLVLPRVSTYLVEEVEVMVEAAEAAAVVVVEVMMTQSTILHLASEKTTVEAVVMMTE
tara:strand:- start:237 stop:431 length:195 start_codon:yes stop_codon:yes gene_type:complete